MSAPAVRIGNQTSRRVDGRVPFEFALQHGFDAFEWFSEPARGAWCEDLVSPAQRAELRRTAAERGLLFSVHAPHLADPTTLDGAAAIAKSIAFGGDIAAGVVNLHLFPQHSARPYAESLIPLLEAAAAVGVRLSLENTPETSPDHANAVFGVLSAMPAAVGRVGMCLDAGHANLHPATRHDFLGYVDLLGPHVPIIHWHAHENWGDRDSHLTLFTGPSASDDSGVRGLVRRLLQRGFAGSVVMEQWPNPPGLLVEARRRLRQLFAEESASLNRGAAVPFANPEDPFELSRFVQAQQPVYQQALAEIRGGKKRSHWMWYIFPQVDGLGASPMSRRYAIRHLAEAAAYLDHPVLGPRLHECAEAAIDVAGRSAHDIFDSPDDAKLRSCATLFGCARPSDTLFARLLERFFDGEPDRRTLELLGRLPKP